MNLKLRQSSESVKTDLLQIKFDARRYEKLRDLNVAEMSLSEFVEMIVYKNLESVSKTINVGEENREKLNARILRLSEMKSESEITIEGLKGRVQKKKTSKLWTLSKPWGGGLSKHQLFSSMNVWTYL